jgi:prepilin-type N-terminal cleavage/methylation domain-containing protein
VRERLLRDEGGFSLPEVLVTIMIMLTVMFGLYSIFDMGLRVFSFGNDKTEAVENARLGLEKMEREIRAAYPQDKAAGNGTLLTSWTANSIAFGNDLDGNRKIECLLVGTPPCETISYSVYQPSAGSTHALGRTATSDGALQPVVEFVDYVDTTNTGLKFRYFQRDGVTEVLPGGDEKKIAIVSIELRIKVQRGARPGTQTLTTDVALRNRVN